MQCHLIFLPSMQRWQVTLIICVGKAEYWSEWNAKQEAQCSSEISIHVRPCGRAIHTHPIVSHNESSGICPAECIDLLKVRLVSLCMCVAKHGSSNPQRLGTRPPDQLGQPGLRNLARQATVANWANEQHGPPQGFENSRSSGIHDMPLP